MQQTKHYNNAYRDALKDKIKHMPGNVFSRKDLTKDRSNKEQLRLNRAIRAFIDEKLIIKIAHGLYAKARPMTLSTGEVHPVLLDSFETISMEALDKLGLEWELGSAIQEYNAGKTTQVPALFSVRLKSRFRGSISAEGRRLVIE